MGYPVIPDICHDIAGGISSSMVVTSSRQLAGWCYSAGLPVSGKIVGADKR